MTKFGPNATKEYKKPCEICGKIVQVRNYNSRAVCVEWHCQYEFNLVKVAEERKWQSRCRKRKVGRAVNQ